MTTGLRPGQVASAAGVNLQTLRYYERRGLIAEPDRTLGGHRLYPEQAVTHVRVIKAAQRLWFTLDEVAQLLAVASTGTEGGSTVSCRPQQPRSWLRSSNVLPISRSSPTACGRPWTPGVPTCSPVPTARIARCRSPI